jgi:hypothetical protein
VAVLAKLTVSPTDGQVAILDPAWQDSPEWDNERQAVAFRQPNLIHQDDAPFPGFAVATRQDVEGGHRQTVVVELWEHERPQGLHLVHTSVLGVCSEGVTVGNGQGDDVRIPLPPSEPPLEIYTDSEEPRLVSRVVFVVNPLVP